MSEYNLLFTTEETKELEKNLVKSGIKLSRFLIFGLSIGLIKELQQLKLNELFVH